MTIHKSLKLVAAAALLSCSSLTLAPTAFALQQAPQKAPAVLVSVKEAGEAMLAPQSLMPGTIVSRNDSRISAQVAGRIDWVAPEGTMVKKGDVIARIDSSDFDLQVARSRSQVARLEARLTYLKSQLTRIKELAARNNSSTAQLEEAASNMYMTRQDLAQARIALKQALLAQDRTQVRAPFPGRVVARLAQTGEYSMTGSQILRLVDVTHLEVTAQAPVKLSAFIKDGQAVSLMVNNQRYETTVRAQIPVGDTISRTMEIRVDVPLSTDDADWVVGSAVQVSVPSQQPSKQVTIDRDALVLRLDGTYIFRVGADNKAERLKVNTGAAIGNRVAIVGDLKSGDKVVVRGGERLRSGQEVRLSPNKIEAVGR